MWDGSLAIQSPYGLCVFGSALVKGSPDSALISAAVTRLEKKPSDSFTNAKDAARSVAEFLRGSRIEDFGTSRISLSQDNRFVSGELRFLGYKATVGFTVMIHALERLEEIVSGVIDAGANEITSIDFRTSKLKDLRAQARRLAIDAAKEKGMTYSEAASVLLGDIIHIQDVNAQLLQRQWRSQFHAAGASRSDQMERELIDNTDAGKQTLDPGAIEVAAAVLVAFSLKQKS